MARQPKSTDTAAKLKAADTEAQKQEQTSTDVGDQVERTPTATELAGDHPEIFGEETTSEEDSTKEEITPADRRPDVTLATPDEIAAAQDGEPKNEPAKSLGDVKVGQRVMLYTANPIGGQTVNPAFITGFSASTGNANVRLELTDGAAARAQEFSNVPKDAAIEERGAYFRLAEDIAKEGEEAASE